MKSYLSLIPIAAKVHRRENRMTLLCIIFAVFMVTSVFSMADMGIRIERFRLGEKHGQLSVQQLWESAMGQTLLPTAVILFFLILIAGVLMISGSINSSVVRRTQFFGMMRCIGMSRQQIIRFVRLEALNWCKTAIPVGLLFGIVATWGMCIILHFFVGEEFSYIPLFGISPVGIASGIAVGIVTVLLAARTPAKRAAKVAPAVVVSGNIDYPGKIHHPVKLRKLRIETALGIHHGMGARKNLLLLTGSFAFCIILFLSFSVLIDFVNCLMPQSSASSDLEISSESGDNSIDSRLTERIRGMKGVEQVYGRRSCFDVPAKRGNALNDDELVDLVSFDDFDLSCLKKDGVLRRGSDLSKVYGDSSYVLATWDPDSSWKIGDKVLVGTEEVEIAGLLKYDPFSENGLTGGKMTLIASGDTFIHLTGETGYSLVMVQIRGNVTEKEVRAIQQAAEGYGKFVDKREQQTGGTYLAFVICVYGFLSVIALVTVLNIVNSISMSVSARTREYGAMRAVGMEGRQITKMIAAEAFTYAVTGSVTGCILGLLLHRFLYESLITSHFPYAIWQWPAGSLLVILLFMGFAAVISVVGPAKRIRSLVITDTISEL